MDKRVRPNRERMVRVTKGVGSGRYGQADPPGSLSTGMDTRQLGRGDDHADHAGHDDHAGHNHRAVRL